MRTATKVIARTLDNGFCTHNAITLRKDIVLHAFETRLDLLKHVVTKQKKQHED